MLDGIADPASIAADTTTSRTISITKSTGGPKAWNHTPYLAAGENVRRTDADDAVRPVTFEECLKAFANGARAVYSEFAVTEAPITWTSRWGNGIEMPCRSKAFFTLSSRPARTSQ